jgi:uncharacterized membrane protein
MKIVLLVLAVLLALGACPAAGNLVVETGPFANTSMITAEMFKKGDDFSIFFGTVRGELVLENATSVDGKLVFIEIIPISYFTTVKRLQDEGAIGIIIAESGFIPGRLYCTWSGEDFVEQIKIPIAQANLEDIHPILEIVATSTVVKVTLSSEGNQWTDVITSPAFLAIFRVILLMIGCCVSIFALVKLMLYIYYQGSEFNVPQICLAIEFIGNCLRVVALGDPFGCGFIYPFGAVSILQQMNGILTQPTFYLLTMYWYEAMTIASIRIYPFLSKMRIPFYVFTCVLLLLAVMFPLLNLFLGIRIIDALAGLYAGISLAFLIFYIVTIVKIMRRLAKSNADKKKRRMQQLLKINRDMIMSGVAKFASVVVGLLFIVDDISTRPLSYMTVWGVLFLALYVDSFCRIWTFNLDSVRRKYSSRSSAKSPSATTRTQTQTHTTVDIEM